MALSSGSITRCVVAGALGIATLAIFAASARSNYLYGYSLGQSDEKRTLFAWANVAADVWKACGLIALHALWRNRQWKVAILGALAWLFCLMSGVNSAIGVYIQDRASLTGTRETRHANYKDTERELRDVESKLRALPQHRSIGEIDAGIAVLLTQPVVVDDRLRGTVATLTSDCKRPDKRTLQACAEIAVLRSERATAEEASRLEQYLQHLRRQVGDLREAGGAQAPDPIGEFYAWFTGGLLSVRDVGFGFPLFFAVLVEVVSAFGPITVVRFAEVSIALEQSSDTTMPRRAVAGQDTLQRAPAEPADEQLALWMSERATPNSQATAVTLKQLHADYHDWCLGHDLAVMDALAFARQFDRLRKLPELDGKIRKFGNRYYGIKLADKVPMQQMR